MWRRNQFQHFDQLMDGGGFNTDRVNQYYRGVSSNLDNDREYRRWENQRNFRNEWSQFRDNFYPNMPSSFKNMEHFLQQSKNHLNGYNSTREFSTREFNRLRMLSQYTDSLLLRTNFYLAKEKSDFRSHSQHLSQKFGEDMIFMPHLSLIRGPLMCGAPFLPQPVEFDLVNIGFHRSCKVEECPVSGQLRFQDQAESDLFRELMGKVFEGLVYN